MGGTMSVESEPGRGSQFHFSVNVAPASGEAPAWSAGHPALTGKRALIVDNCGAQRRLLAEFAQRWGVATIEADTATAAETILRGNATFDLLLLDHDLPASLSAAQLKSLPGSGNSAVLVMSFRRFQRGDASALGADACLTKPIRPSVLFDAMVRIVAGPTPRDRRTANAGPLERPLAERFPLRLLLADDNRVNQTVGVALLKRLGYSVDVVANGVEVLRALDRRTYDAIFLDVQMPEMDGYETARRIRERFRDSGSARPHVIAMTAGAMEGDRDRCLEAGMDDYLAKPVRPESLRAAIERWGAIARRQ
jgi:CheY-like chemotaxis protein